MLDGISRLAAQLRKLLDEEPVAGVLLDRSSSISLPSLIAAFIATSALCGLFLAIVQSSSATQLLFLPSWLFWALHCAIAFGSILAMEWLLLSTDWKRPFRIALALLALPVLLAPFSLFLDNTFEALDTDGRSNATGIGAYPGEVLDVAPLAMIMSAVALFVLNQIWIQRRSAPLSDSDTPKLSGLLEDFPVQLGDDLIRVSAQDHYCEIVTSLGKHLLPVRFSDCIAALMTYDGVQTHRSHWVSLQHIKELETSGSAHVCQLSNGDTVPVSRRRYSALRHTLRSQVERTSARGGRQQNIAP
ncbi:MAG: LytTR family DNA-binding domain-containing protein [Pseudomonadota bacterium]